MPDGSSTSDVAAGDSIVEFMIISPERFAEVISFRAISPFVLDLKSDCVDLRENSFNQLVTDDNALSAEKLSLTCGYAFKIRPQPVTIGWGQYQLINPDSRLVHILN